MELLSTERDTFPPSGMQAIKKCDAQKGKHGLCDRFCATDDNHRDHEARYAQSLSHEHTEVEMCQRRKNNDKSRQSSTLEAKYVGSEPIDDQAADLCCLARYEIGLPQ